MKKEEIKRLAGLAEVPVGITGGNPTWEQIQKFAAMVAAAEREACAAICDERAAKSPMGSDEQCEGEDCAAAIRARGQK